MSVATEPATRERIYAAAVELFYFSGYPGASIRDITDLVGINPATLYHHFPSKRAMLLEVMGRTMDELIFAARQAADRAMDPTEELVALVKTHVLFHCTHTKEATVTDRELNSLPVNFRATMVAKRDEYELIWAEVIRAGVRDGHFDIDDQGLTRTALLTMCSQVESWYDALGRLSAPVIADAYSTLALRIVGASKV